jgi:hypothetical protein
MIKDNKLANYLFLTRKLFKITIKMQLNTLATSIDADISGDPKIYGQRGRSVLARHAVLVHDMQDWLTNTWSLLLD